MSFDYDKVIENILGLIGELTGSTRDLTDQRLRSAEGGEQTRLGPDIRDHRIEIGPCQAEFRSRGLEHWGYQLIEIVGESLALLLA